MLLNKRFALVLFLIFANIHTAKAQTEKDHNNCHEHLKTLPEYSYERFAEIQKQKAAKQGAILPEFTDPKAEKAAQQTWQGIATPELFKKLLPEGVSFVSHSLRKADAGFVKSAGTGDAVILRVTMPYKNRTYSTNVTVPISALMDNLNRQDKWLIGPEAAACIDWGHGGGTKDTGEHTAFGPLNYFLKFGIAVIGQSQPWHSEGDRDFTDTPDEYLTEIRQEFLKKFVHPSVPKFGVGHSLGGLYADMQWRRLSKDSVYSGFVSLSGIPDDCPGCSPDQKMKAELAREKLQKEPQYFQRLAPGDQKLGVTLIKQLKISALSMFFTQFTELGHNWNKIVPEENRLPILYVWGEGDFLYVGAEELIKNLRGLKNVDVVTFIPRVEYSGKVENVGHLIFDHWRTLLDSTYAVATLRNYLNLSDSIPLEQVKEQFKEKVLKAYVHPYTFDSKENNSADALLMAGYYYNSDFASHIDTVIKQSYKNNKKDFFLQFVQKETPETFVLIREMIEKTLQKKITERKEYSPAAQENAMLANLAHRYANDLVAREVYQGVVIKDFERKAISGVGGDESEERFPVDRVTTRAKILDEVVNAINSLEKQKKNKKISEEDFNKKVAELLETYRVKLQAPQGKRTGIEWTVEALNKQRAALYAILARNYTFPGSKAKEVEENVKQRIELKKQLTALTSEKKKLSQNLKDLTKQLSDKEKRFEKLLESANLHKDDHLVKVYELNAKLEQQLAQLMKVDLEVREGNAAYLQKLFAAGTLSRENLNNLPKELVDLYARYTRETKKYQAMNAEVITEIKQLSASGQLGPEWQTLYTEIWDKDGLVERLHKVQEELLKIELAIDKTRITSEDLLERYVTHLVPGLFSARVLLGADLLNFSYEQSAYKTLQTLSQKVQAITNTILKDMPPAGATELY